MAGTVATTSVKTQTTVQAGDTIANTGVATNFATNWAMPANFLTVGRGVRVRAWGVYSTLGALPGTLNIDLMAGATVLCSTGAQALTAGIANEGWIVEADIICISTGAGGTVESQGWFNKQTAVLLEDAEFMTNAAVVNLDTTAAKNIQIRVTWGTANAANTITQRLLIVDILGTQ